MQLCNCAMCNVVGTNHSNVCGRDHYACSAAGLQGMPPSSRTKTHYHTFPCPVCVSLQTTVVPSAKCQVIWPCQKQLAVTYHCNGNIRGQDKGLAVERCVQGTLMTSFQMAGFSITLLKVTPDNLACLDAATDVGAWSVAVVYSLGMMCICYIGGGGGVSP